MVNVSAARQEQVLLFGVAVLLVTVAAIFTIVGNASWPQWCMLVSSILVVAVAGYVRRSPKPAKLIINALLVASVALSVTGIIGMLAERL